jgi:hypothetical protein
MANTITKLTANGNYYLSGGLDEVSGTYSTNGLICYWPTYSPSFVAGSQWIDIVNGNNLYIPTSNIYNPAYSTTYSNAVYATNNLFFGVGSTAYNVNIPQLAGATSCTVEGVIKIQSFSGGMVAAFAQYDIYTGGGGLGYNTANSDNYGITATQVTNLGITGKYAHYVFVLNTFPSGTGTYANNQIWINGVQQTLTQNQGLCATSGRGFNNYNGGSLPGSQFPMNYSFTINSWPNQFGSYTLNNGFGGLRMYNRTLTQAEIIQNYNVAASNPAFGLTPISAPPQSSLTINSTTQNTATFLANSIDEVTYNPVQTVYRKNLLNNSAKPNITTGATFPYTNWNGTFANTSVTLTANTTAPDGTYTAYKFVEGLSVNPQYVFWQQNFIGQYGTTYTYSMYVKAAEYNYVILTIYDTSSLGYYFNLTTGAVSGASAGITYGSLYVGNGWWRIWLTRTFQNLSKNGQIFFNFNPAGTQFYAGDGVSGGYFWGPQVEIGSTPTIYEPTDVNAIPSPTALSKLDSNGNSYLAGSYDEYTRGFNIVQNGLIYYMDPSKPESWNGSALINDITNTYAPATINSGFTYNTSGGGSIQLDGQTGFVNTVIVGNTAQFLGNSTFTMSVWAKTTGTTPFANSGNDTLFGAASFGGFGIFFSYAGGSVNNFFGELRTATIGAPIGQIVATSTTGSLSINTWYNFTWVYSYSGNINSLYLNGSLVGTNQSVIGSANNFLYSIGTETIGVGGSGGASYGYGPIAGNGTIPFPGQIGQALIYNRALSAAEVLQNYNEMKSQYTI